MPIIKSAIKRVRVAQRNQKVNQVTKNKFREPVKEFIALVGDKKIEEAKKLFPRIQKTIDLAAKKHILHKNTAARKKSRLAKMIAGSGTTEKVAPKTTEVEKKSEKTTTKTK